MEIDHNYQIDSRYSRGFDEPPGRIYMSGTQALVRLLLAQAASDKAAGCITAGFVSGYRGSPLGAVDKEMWRAAKQLKKAGIHFQPAINEELAASALIGTQKVETDPTRQVEGVYSLWYGKGPGVDRAGDALKHGNAYGSSPKGGVLAVVGDDHGCVSSSMSHQSDHTLIGWSMPIIHPSGIADYVPFGLWGWALSRFSGTWVGFKAISETVEGSASIETELRPRFILPKTDPGPDGLHWRWPDLPGMQIERRLAYKLAAVTAFAKANPLDRQIVTTPQPRMLIASVGKAYGDVMEALTIMGLSADILAEAGIVIIKIGLVYPLSPLLAEVAEGMNEILVIEEKRAVVENLLKQHLYNVPSDRRPIVLGKFDERQRPLLPEDIELCPSIVAPVLADCLNRYNLVAEVPRKWRIDLESESQSAVVYLTDSIKEINTAKKKIVPKRTPYFCSGCPHNISTLVPKGSRAQLGIGCHAMAVHMDRSTSGSVQMGGEGVDWVGQAPFVKEPHIFQNIGDGTFFHSGHLAIRQAVASGTNITYKILYNDAVAMTGGQPIDGSLTVPQITQLAVSEGAKQVVVVADYPQKYPANAGFPDNTDIRHRDDLDTIQCELREIPGVTVIVYDQVCATEVRRRRKRAKQIKSQRRVVINELVCEGCGDCQVKSNCLSVIPIDTILGRKRMIEQSTCNSDLSCLKGFCPSFVTVDADVSPQADDSRLPTYQDILARAASYPTPNHRLGSAPFELLIAGIGGTGIVTVSALVAMAAHLQGLGVSVLDFTGFAQKGGSVLSYIRIAHTPKLLNQVRIDRGSADAFLAADLVVATQAEPLAMLAKGRTKIVANTREIHTGSMLRDANSRIDIRFLEIILANRVDAGDYRSLDVQSIAEQLVGGIQTNVFMLGYAWQLGLVPVSFAALDRAFELNGVEVEANRRAFAWGRLMEADPDYVTGFLSDTTQDNAQLNLDELIAHFASFLTEYQSSEYGARFQSQVAAARIASERLGDESFAEAVARSLFKLMAYKDEYEVARLHSRTDFLERLGKSFKGKLRPTFYMAPPFSLQRIFSRNKGNVGKEPRKIALGLWMVPVLRLLASMKFLRGTVFDVFAYTFERKKDRQLIAKYEEQLAQLIPKLSKANLSVALELVSLPTMIRGFGQVKAQAIELVERKEVELLESFLSLQDSDTLSSQKLITRTPDTDIARGKLKKDVI